MDYNAEFYMSIRVPDPAIREYIDWCRSKFGHSCNEKSKPHHVTIVTPKKLVKGAEVNHLINNIDRMLEGIMRFPVQTTGLGYFADKSDIHVTVEKTEQFSRCHEALMQACDGLIILDDDPYVSIPNPHITLASGLVPPDRNKVWQDANKKQWEGAFYCDKIQLLCRMPGEKEWAIIAVFSLN